MKNYNTTFIISLSLTFIMSLTSFGQNILLKECGFDYKRNIQLQDSNYLKLEIESEFKIAQQLGLPQSRTLGSVYNIPVVVHVLHLGEAVGTGTNISDAQIQSAITNLNDVYRGNTANSTIDFEIQFSLAQQDSNCNAHSGINRINASSVPNYSIGGVDYYEDGGEADENTLKNLSRWPETEYFNIWIVSEIEDNDGGSGIQGYANFFYGSAYEGSVMMASVFGFDPNNNQPSFNLNSPRDNSTVVHEFGHYLHLHHTFKGDGDADQDGIGDSCAADITIGVDSDGCSDTEVHKRFTSQCKSGQLNDCTGATFGDNTAKNYMSYAFCVDRLTSDQKTRSRAMLETTGISLIYSKGDEAPTNYSTTIANANCAPQTSSSGLAGHFTGIKNFKIDGIFTNTSSWTDTDGGYVDNTLNCQKVINIFEDSTYTFEVTTLAYANNVKGYIDFNNDGDFLDSNEQILNLNTFDNNVSPYYSTVSQSYTIPSVNGSSVISGNKLRLRLNSDFGTVANACEAPQYGQVEDYTIIINELIANLTSDFSASDSTLCPTNLVSFSNLSTGANAYLWDFGDGTTSILQNPTHTYSTPGTYDVSLTANSGTNTITETKTGFITINPSPNINAGIDQTICSADSVTLNATSGQNYTVGVTAVNASNYILSGAVTGNDPAINISLGDTLTFNVNSPGHPFLIKTTNTTGTANSVAVTNNGTSSGSIIWSPTVAGIYYYICEFHGGMVGTITVGSNVNYTWDNSVINGVAFTPTATNIYTVTGTDGNGCFATDNVTVNLLVNTTGTSVVTGCGTYTWIDGLTYTATNNSATYTLTNSAGCDSVVTLNLTINQTLTGTDVISSCDSITWIDGITYTSSNNSSTYTIQSANGCDSLVNLNLTINQSQTGTDVISSCDSITWIDGITYYSSNNTATYATQTANGCDSLVNLNLTINQSSSSLDVISSCDSITWIDGITYNSSNNSATYTLTNLSGCDSVITLNLTINQSSSSIDVISSCDSITWIDGNTYYSSNNTANYNFANSAGCDSVVTLNLTINQASFGVDVITACDSLVWIDGNTYYSNNNYATDTLINANGCDSIITLNLTISTWNLVWADEFSGNGAIDTSKWYHQTFIPNGTGWYNGEVQHYTDRSDNSYVQNGNLHIVAKSEIFTDPVQGITKNYTSARLNSKYAFTYGRVEARAKLPFGIGTWPAMWTLGKNINETGAYWQTQGFGTTNWPACGEIDIMEHWGNNQNYIKSALHTPSSFGSTVNVGGIMSNDVSNTYHLYAMEWTPDKISFSLDGVEYYSYAPNPKDPNNWPFTEDQYLLLNIALESSIDPSFTQSEMVLDFIRVYQQDSTSNSSIDTQSSCDSLSWIDGITYTSNNNTATYTLQSSAGCDSVVTLNLTVSQSSIGTDVISACDSLNWIDGFTYSSSNNSATYNLTNSAGCDSLVTLNLTVNQSSTGTDVITVCDSITWIDGITYSSNNNSATYTLQNSLNCDSLVNLDLTINSSSSNFFTTTSCSSYIWNGQTLTASGIYVDTNVNSAGCPLIDSLNLIINNTPNVTTEISCDSLIWNGTTYTTSGTYFTTGSSCVDSLYLTINNSNSSISNITSCDSLLWNGINYSNSGSYNFLTTNSNGCDSTATLILVINQTKGETDVISTCDSVNWIDGNTYTSSNNSATFTLQTATGCDSIVTLNLTINSTIISSENITACNSYSWNGNTYNQSGTYYDSSLTANGCDSISTLNLTIDSVIITSQNINACNSYSWNGVTYNQSGTYYDSSLTASGCDSISTLNLTIDSVIITSQNISACNSYAWNGVSYNQSGTYYDSSLTSSGCDSISTLKLTIDSVIITFQNISACNSYSWNGNTYSQSGTYLDSSLTAGGCDSVSTLILTINSSNTNNVSISACGSYSWNGVTYNQSGTYYDSLINTFGCDSVTILSLTINQSTNNNIPISACNSYSWNGVTYTQSGIYVDSSTSSLGCDSIVTLNLTINNSYSNIDTVNSCNSYSWNGNTYTQSGIYYDSLSSLSGCDSVNILSLIISGNIFTVDTVAACQSYIWNGNQYDSSGVYIDTVLSSVTCDSIQTLYLTINDDVTSPITLELLLDDYCLETFWSVKDSQDSVWYSGQNYNCNPSGGGAQANTTITEIMFLDPNDCYTFELNDYYGDGLGASVWNGTDGNWIIKDLNNIVIGQGQGDFGFIVEYSFLVGQSVVTSVIENQFSNAGIAVYPNPFNESTTVKIQNIDGPHTIEVFDISGRIVKSLTTNSSEFTLENISSSGGVYWLVVKNQSSLKPVKLIIE